MMRFLDIFVTCVVTLLVTCVAIIVPPIIRDVVAQASSPGPVTPGGETPGDDPTPDNPGGNETPVALSNCEFLIINDTQAFLTRYATEATSVNDTDLPQSFTLGPVEEKTYQVTDWHDEEFRMLMMERRIGYTDDEIRELEEAYMNQTLQLPYTYYYGVQTYTEGNDYEVIGIGGTGGSVFPSCVTSITLPLSYKIIGYHALVLGVKYTEINAPGAIVVGAHNFSMTQDEMSNLSCNFSQVAYLGYHNFGQTWTKLEIFPRLTYYPAWGDYTKHGISSVLDNRADIQLISDIFRYIEGGYNTQIIVPDALVDTYKAINSSWIITPLSQAQGA